MGKIERLDTTHNVECFPRTLNRQDPNKAYFIDSQRPTNSFARLFTTPTAINAKIYPAYVTTMNDVTFENAKTFSITLKEKTLVNAHQHFQYVCDGTAAIMTSAQATAYGDAAVAGETTFCVLAYQSGFVGATQIKAEWLASIDADFDDSASVAAISASGIEASVFALGTTGAQYYRVDVLDANDAVLCTYVWDLSAFITA